MSNTTVAFHGREFVANDLYIEYWLFAVSQQIASDSTSGSWLQALGTEWQLQATAGFGFGPSPALDHYLTSRDHVEQLDHIFAVVLEKFTHQKPDITPEALSSQGIGGPDAIYSQSLPLKHVIEVGQQFRQLIRPRFFVSGS